MSAKLRLLMKFLASEDGPTSVEYATLLALIAVGVLGILTTFGDNVSAMYEEIATAAGG